MGCAVEGCLRGGNTRRGLCQMHYGRWRRNGAAGGSEPIKIPNTMIPWLIAHSTYDGEDCLRWPFHTSHKYGLVSTKATGRIQANRLMCILAHGEPPTPKHQAAHSCGNGHLGCLNPKHLSWKTGKENMADKKIHGTSQEGEKNPSAKITEAQAIEVISRLSRGEKGKQIATELDISRSAVSMIRKGRNWLHLSRPDSLTQHGNKGRRAIAIGERAD